MNMVLESFDDLRAEVFNDRDARTAALENELRRRLASTFEAIRQREGMSVRDFAERIGTSTSQAQRLLHHEIGGSLTLRTLVRAADKLGVAVRVHLRPKGAELTIVPGVAKAPWHRAEERPAANIRFASGIRPGGPKGPWHYDAGTQLQGFEEAAAG